MRAPLVSALLTGALLITGCGGPAEQTAEPSASAPRSATASSSKATVPLLTSCLSLFGESSPSLAEEDVVFINGLEAIDAENAETAGTIATRLGKVAATAQPELAEPVIMMQALLEDYVRAHEESDDWSTGESYGTAKNAIGDICTPVITAADTAQSTPVPSAIARELTDDEKFLEALRAAHPAMKSTDTARMVGVAKNFCLIYDTATANGKADLAPSAVTSLITAAAGIEYTLAELHTIHKAGVTVFCPQHTDKLS